MKWSWKITRLAGIDIYLHTTFLLLVAWIGVSAWLAERSVPAVVEGVLFLLALFGCVLLHELGHALAARRFGIPTRDITLLPIGGVARLERMPEKPAQELWVALAGPLVNVVIAAGLFIGLFAAQALEPLSQLSLTRGNFFERLLVVNVSLVLFNLIPAFPMDGGRVVRALLAMKLDYARATRLAAWLGQVLAIILGFIGLFSNVSLLLIAIFIFLGAGQEAESVQAKAQVSGYRARDAMLTDFHALSPTDPIARPKQLLLNSSQQDFPVVVDGKVVGLLSRAALIRGLIERDERSLVSYAMLKTFDVVHEGEVLDEVIQRIQSGQQGAYPVIQNQSLVGLITLENIAEFLMIENAARARRTGRLMDMG